MNKKHLAFFIYNLTSGGAERVVVNLANELQKNYRISIITFVPCISFYEVHRNITMLDCDINAKKKYFYPKYFFAIQRLTHIIKKEKIDLIIGFTTTINILTVLCSKLAGIPNIISERNNPKIYAPNLIWRAIRNNVYCYTDCLVVQTKANKTFYSKLIPEKKITVIGNPISKHFKKKRKSKRTNSPNEFLKIVTVGRLDYNKGHDFLLKSFAIVCKKHPNLNLLIIGDGILRNNMELLAKQLRLTENVTFIGHSSKVEDFYNDADIFVFTSRSEGYPNALLEAYYFGVPLISTDCPDGPSDIIEHGKDGYLIEVDNTTELTSSLEKLINNYELRKKMSETALKRAGRYEVDNIKIKWIEKFDELLNRKTS